MTERTAQTILEEMDAEYARARREPREKFLKDVSNIAIEWAKSARCKEDVATGVVFTLLAMFDGCSLGSPPVDLAYNFSTEEVDEPGTVFNDTARGLHDDFYEAYREQAAKCGFPTNTDPANKTILSSTIVDANRMMSDLVDSATRALQRGNPEEWSGSEQKDAMARANALCMVSELMADGLIPGADRMADDQNCRALENRGGRAQQMAAEILSVGSDVDLAQPEAFNTVVPRQQRVEQFVENCANIVDYWTDTADTPAEAAEGTMMSVLTMIDGAGDVPPLDLVPAVVPELITEYNEVGTAGWPAEPINSKISLSEAYTENVMQRKRRQAAEALSGD